MNISVVIPCRNEQKYIQECVEAIYASVLPEGIEMRVFVVDGMSNDGTRERVSTLITKFPSLKLVDNTKQLTPFAFNLGIYASGKVDFVQIVGARHVLSPDYLATCLEKLQQDASIWCVGGRIVNEYINETGRIISKAMSSSFGMGIGNFRTLNASGFTDTVTSPMYPYAVFEKIGFFDEELIRNQDDDFNFRVTQAGKDMVRTYHFIEVLCAGRFQRIVATILSIRLLEGLRQSETWRCNHLATAHSAFVCHLFSCGASMFIGRWLAASCRVHTSLALCALGFNDGLSVE